MFCLTTFCGLVIPADESSEEEYMASLRRPMRQVREYARAIGRTQVAERVLARVNQARALRQTEEQNQVSFLTCNCKRLFLQTPAIL